VIPDGRTPVFVVTGFLGSGKTTLVNRLIATPRFLDSLVVVNESGEVPVDHHASAVRRRRPWRCRTGASLPPARDLEEALIRRGDAPSAAARSPGSTA
jgi:hypothetical protein